MPPAVLDQPCASGAELSILVDTAQSRAHLDAVSAPDIAFAWPRMRSVATGLNQKGFPR